MKKLLAVLLIAVFAISLFPIASFAATPVRYEAENALLNAGEVRNPDGGYEDTVSGQLVGGFDGQSDAVIFTVKADKAGTYLLTIAYACCDMRSYDVTVNGNKTEDFQVPATTSKWQGDVKTYSMEITLNAGENEISLGQNDGKNVPNLDYIEISAVDCKHTNTKVEGTKKAELGVPGYTGDTVCADCGYVVAEGEKTYLIPEYRYEAELATINAGEIREAYGSHADAVSNGKFVGGFDGQTDAVVFNVTVEKAGTYKMVIGYISMDLRSYDVTVNGDKTENYAFTEGTADWNGDTKTYTMEITLNAGDNTITFGQNDGQFVPSLDYIDILPVNAEPTPETPENPPKTGDVLSISIGLAVVALAGAVVVTSKKRIAE